MTENFKKCAYSKVFNVMVEYIERFSLFKSKMYVHLFFIFFLKSINLLWNLVEYINNLGGPRLFIYSTKVIFILN